MIEFTTSFGKFLLPIKATLPEHVLEMPQKIDFSFCPTRETARKTFVLKNTGELESYYEWDIPAPFSIHPRKGSLESGASEIIRVEFTPKVRFLSQLTSRTRVHYNQRLFVLLEINLDGKSLKCFKHSKSRELENTLISIFKETKKLLSLATFLLGNHWKESLCSRILRL